MPETQQTQYDGQRQALLAAIVSCSREAIISRTLEGRITSWNAAAERLYGYPAEEMVGRMDEALRPAGREDVLTSALARLLRGQPVEEFQACRMRKNGQPIRVAVLISLLLDAKGKVSGWVTQEREIAGRAEVEESSSPDEAQWRLAIQAAGITGWCWDILRDEITWTEAGQFTLGEPAQEGLTNRSLLEMVHPEDRQRVQDSIAALLAGNRVLELDFRVSWRDGKCYWVMTKGRVISDEAGRPIKIVGVGMDITPRKQFEAQLAWKAEQLQEADRSKNEFLAMLAHELRNPLAPIRYATQMLRHVGVDHDAAMRQQEMIDRQVGHMARLLDDLLDVSRITHGKILLHKAPLDLREVVGQALETMRPAIIERGHQLTYDKPAEPFWVEGDLTRLEQVLRNLLANAAKYTERGGEICLSLEREGPGPDANWPAAVVRVRDSGIGIEPEMLPRIFDLFAQADQTMDRAQGGLGIGLTLARQLVQLHGGAIQAFSEGTGKGSEFVLHLPLIQPAPPEAGGSDHPARGPGASAPRQDSRKVLVVEDNQDTAVSLGELLEVWGHSVRLAYDGPAALVAALDFLPDVVLLDIGLPLVDGFQVARLIRKQPALDQVRLVALTGYGQEEDRRRAEEAGFDAYLTKPVELERLNQVLS